MYTRINITTFDDKLLKITVKNATLAYKDGMKLVLKLTKPAVHGDIKDFTRKPVLVGTYSVEKIWQNCYGTQIRILFDGTYYDIEPQYFEWYREDQ